MLEWDKRPIEIANLLNPPFCSVLLNDYISSFQEDIPEGMPYALSFLVLPIVLHKSTRELLPRSIRTKLHVWLQEKPQVRLGFSQRTQQLVPYSREGLLFGLKSGVISVNDANLKSIKSLNQIFWSADKEPDMCRSKARFLGHWFAKSGNIPSIFVMWGIQL